jgi:hypothetical protein
VTYVAYHGVPDLVVILTAVARVGSASTVLRIVIERVFDGVCRLVVRVYVLCLIVGILGDRLVVGAFVVGIFVEAVINGEFLAVVSIVAVYVLGVV